MKSPIFFVKNLFSASHKWRMYVIYWIGYVLLFSLIQGIPTKTILVSFFNELFGLVPKIIFVAIIIEWLMDSLFFKKKVAKFILIYILLLLLFATIQRFIDNYIILEYFLTNWMKEPLFSTPPFLYSAIKLQFVVTVPFCIKLFDYWSRERNRVREIQSEKMKAELDSLRNQFQPHFLFNVLNSLYAKILNKSDDSAEIVLKISSLLRFSVFHVNANAVALRKEIDYLSSYISLQKIRFDNRLELSFSATGDIENKMIEPFLILPFIENSFKYCMNDDLMDGWITIHLAVQDNWLIAKIENSLTAKKGEGLASHGLGLNNVKRRLELLYPDTHVLKIIKNDDSFFVSLKLKLDAGN